MKTEKYRFGSLECSVLSSEKKWLRIEPNHEEPFEIKSDYFQGSGLVLIKTSEAPDADRYQRTIFDESKGRTRLFEVQLRGEFTAEPPGMLWIAGELEAERMRMSALARLAGRASLSFLRAMGGDGLHYSFGDKSQAPHIATPLWSSIPLVHASRKQHQANYADYPALGHVLDSLENEAIKKNRRAAGPNGAARQLMPSVPHEAVYTFALNAANADMRAWLTVMPGLPSIDLHRLWHDSPLIVAIYAIENYDKNYDTNTPHDKGRKRYLTAIRIKHIPRKDQGEKEPKRKSLSHADPSFSSSSEGEEVSEDESDIFYDARSLDREQSDAGSESSFETAREEAHCSDDVQLSSPRRATVRARFAERFGFRRLLATPSLGLFPTAWSVTRCEAAFSRRPFFHEDEIAVDRLFIDRREYFIIRNEAKLYMVQRRRLRPVTCTLETAERFLKKETGLSRLSATEKKRRQVVATVSALEKASELEDWLRFHNATTAEAAALLSPDFFLRLEHSVTSGRDIKRLGPCLRASTRSVWYAEWIMLIPYEGLFFYYGGQLNFFIELADLVSDGAYATYRGQNDSRNTHNSALAGMANQASSFEIATAERVIRIVVSDQDERDAWIKEINDEFFKMNNAPAAPLFVLAKESASLEPLASSRASKKETKQDKLLRDRLATPGEEYFPRGRYILNARSPFTQFNISDNLTDTAQLSAYASDLLFRAGNLVAKQISSASSSPNDDNYDKEWYTFLELSGALRFIENVSVASLAFWLNIYHCMVCHAALHFGAPARAKDFAAHFGSLCYECAGEIFSLAELEHCIIRNALPRPCLLLSDTKLLGSSALDLLRIASATSTKIASTYSFALTNTNRLLGLALNPGGDPNTSIPIVPIYDDENIQTQISAAITAALACAKMRGSLLILPRKCAWHSIPFEDIQNHLPKHIQLALSSDCDVKPGVVERSTTTVTASNSNQAPTPPGLRIKYLPFDYQCQPPNILPHKHASPALRAYCANANATAELTMTSLQK